jgi:hypothetical protein
MKDSTCFLTGESCGLISFVSTDASSCSSSPSTVYNRINSQTWDVEGIRANSRTSLQGVKGVTQPLLHVHARILNGLT